MTDEARATCECICGCLRMADPDIEFCGPCMEGKHVEGGGV